MGHENRQFWPLRLSCTRKIVLSYLRDWGTLPAGCPPAKPCARVTTTVLANCCADKALVWLLRTSMEYHLKPIGKTCAASGQPLAPGSLIHSVLVERHGELVRLDYSPEGWSGPPKGAIANWRTLVPVPAADGPIKFDVDQLQRYFEQLSDEFSPNTEKLRYVLALLLLQKRRLRLENARTDGDDEVLELSGTHGEGNYEIRNLRLAELETRQLQQELRSHLSSEWS